MLRSPRFRVAGLAFLCCGLLALPACEDPSGVGITVGEFDDIHPRTRVLEADAQMAPLADATGFLRVGFEDFPHRFIAGRAEDPLYGTIRATGYVDFMRPEVIPEDFLLASVAQAALVLRPDYHFGNTHSAAIIDLYEIESEWNSLLFRSDTTLAVKPALLTTFPIAAGDTLVTVPLPQWWVAARDSLLRSPQFTDEFHGFQLRPRDESGLAVGIAGNAALRVTSTAETEDGHPITLSFPAASIATGSSWTGPAAAPPEVIPLQDNSGHGLRLSFRMDELDTRALSGGTIRVEADTLLVEAGRPAGFVRPIARTLQLFGIGDGPPVLLAEATLNTAQEAYIFSGRQVSLLLQDMAMGRSRFDHVAIGFPRTPSTLDVAPLVRQPGAPPRAIVVVVPTSF